MVARLRREGGSVAFTIPAAVARDLGIKAGDLVVVRAYQGACVFAKVEVMAAAEAIAKGEHGEEATSQR